MDYEIYGYDQKLDTTQSDRGSCAKEEFTETAKSAKKHTAHTNSGR